MVSASPVIAAHFFDGSSGCLHPARLDVREGMFTVITAGFAQSYPQADVTLSEPFAAAPLMLRFADGACCEVPARAAREQLLAALGYREGRIVRWQARWRFALLAVALLAALLAMLYLRGVPALTERIVACPPRPKPGLARRYCPAWKRAASCRRRCSATAPPPRSRLCCQPSSPPIRAYPCGC